MNPSSSCPTEMRSQYKNRKDTKNILGARNGVHRRYETNAEDLTRVETVPGRNRSGDPGKKMDCSYSGKHRSSAHRPFQSDSPPSPRFDAARPHHEAERA